jgi:hypothetical protein
MVPDTGRGQNREVYIQPMNCAERVAGHVNGETVTAAAIGDEGGAAELTRNLPRPRSLDPDFIDWDPEDMNTWDERIVMVATTRISSSGSVTG